jgi:hypothetical protein
MKNLQHGNKIIADGREYVADGLRQDYIAHGLP